MLNKTAPKLILYASSQPYLSIGRRFGGVKAFGYEYVYLQAQDAFIRKDYLRKFNKHTKSGGSWENFIEQVKSE